MSLLPVEDGRSPWDRFRRRELYAIASIEGISYKPGDPATLVRQYLMSANVNPMKYTPQTSKLSDVRPERIHVDKKFLDKIEVDKTVIEEAKEELPKLDLETMPMHKLKTWCKQHGIKAMPKDTKPVLLAKAKALIDGENAS